MNKELSERIYKIKAICILCVVYAHMTSENFICGYIMRIIAVLAVPMFFFLSGYFYDYTKSLKEIIIRILEKICIPWWIWGTITYFFNMHISSKSFLFKDLVLWVIGKGTWYYYLTVLVILYMIFKYLNSVKFCLICLAINFLSYMSYAYEIFGIIEFDQYLNIFNWCGFFAFGTLVKKLDLLSQIIEICDTYKVIILLSFFMICVFKFNLGISIEYVNKGAIIGELLGGMSLIILSKYLKSYIYIDLGKETLLIYLMHMQVAGIINTRLPNFWIVDLIKPYLVLMLIYFFIYHIEKYSSKTFLKKILPYLGFRNR